MIQQKGKDIDTRDWLGANMAQPNAIHLFLTLLVIDGIQTPTQCFFARFDFVLFYQSFVWVLRRWEFADGDAWAIMN